jgi:hypothetical protein
MEETGEMEGFDFSEEVLVRSLIAVGWVEERNPTNYTLLDIGCKMFPIVTNSRNMGYDRSINY